MIRNEYIHTGTQGNPHSPKNCQKWQWARHIARRTDDDGVVKFYSGGHVPEGTAWVGSPPTGWADALVKIAGTRWINCTGRIREEKLA